MSATTPMMRQYLEIKSRYPDSILFYRLGDFYEMFMEDALTASKILDIALTSRNKGAADNVPLCGIPYHSCQPYIARLVEQGYKVAICEQVEDPKTAKGIVKRDVVRVITPGLVMDADLLTPKENHYLMALSCIENRWGIAVLDITTGEFRTTETADVDEVRSEITSIEPREILLPEGTVGESLSRDFSINLRERVVSSLPLEAFDPDRCGERIRNFYACASLEPFGCAGLMAAIAAAGAVLHYLEETQKEGVRHLRPLATYFAHDAMILDEATRRNLELTATMRDGSRRGSLLGVMDRTVTSMGGRLLRQWIGQPLIDVERIRGRQDAVEELLEKSLERGDLREALDGIQDLERLISRISLGTAGGKDLVSLKNSLLRLPGILEIVSGLESSLLIQLRNELDPLTDITDLIGGALVDDPPFVVREGGLIRDGFDPELDALRRISRDGKGWIALLEREEREKTGIASLKVRYNRVFGYYIEVTRTHFEKVPDDYVRKQTLANAERYITPALKEYEDNILGAEEKIVEIEYEIFQTVRSRTAEEGKRIQKTAEVLAVLDVLYSLAELAHERDYARPEVNDGNALEIIDGRHPVIEAQALSERFVPNDVKMDSVENQILVITGPNMAGKSTFMRQVALITLLAQTGSFVPARSATVGIVDRIFTRVGASDNLSKGQSTFMVEMTETANILHHATSRSLIVLDEIGRGTSTFDGISIAWSVAEYLHDFPRVAAKTLFATHYHELTELALTRERVKNYNIAVREWNDQIVFLRKIVKGGASHSYGIQVARLAGLPEIVIGRAREILRNLESGEFEKEGHPRLAHSRRGEVAEMKPQLSLFREDSGELRRRLEEIDISVLTPLEALNLLNELKQMV